MDEYDVGRAFQAIEDELIASMMRNMRRHRVEEAKEKMEWGMWQVEQLKALEDYRRENKSRFKNQFSDINQSIDGIIRTARAEGGMSQEIRILEAIKSGFKPKGLRRSTQTTGEFFKLNDRKLNALISATRNDFEKAEHAILRMAEDQYRKIIFNAQTYANTGAGTYEKAVDMATKDFLSAGINCIEYRDGSRHTVSDYADMAIRTASKRAYLTGEGDKRKEWGVSTVIINKRGNACPKCLPYVGKVMIDDVWSGGSAKDGDYPLISTAIANGLYHPRCRDSHTTYFEGVSTPPRAKYTKNELKEIEDDYKREQKQKEAKRQAERFERLARHSLDKGNQKEYGRKAEEWRSVAGSPTLSDKEEGAVIRYVSPDSYVLNDKLRRNTELTNLEKEWIMDLDKALEKLPTYEGDLNRSLYFLNDADAKVFYDGFVEKESKTFTEYLSATKGDVYNPDGQVQIYIRDGKKGKDLGRMNEAEKEVLYPRNSKFTVISKRRVDGKYYILLEES